MYVPSTILSLLHSFSLTFHLFRDPSDTQVASALCFANTNLKGDVCPFGIVTSAQKDVCFQRNVLKIQGMSLWTAIKNPLEKADKRFRDFSVKLWFQVDHPQCEHRSRELIWKPSWSNEFRKCLNHITDHSLVVCIKMGIFQFDLINVYLTGKKKKKKTQNMIELTSLLAVSEEKSPWDE